MPRLREAAPSRHPTRWTEVSGTKQCALLALHTFQADPSGPRPSSTSWAGSLKHSLAWAFGVSFYPFPLPSLLVFIWEYLSASRIGTSGRQERELGLFQHKSREPFPPSPCLGHTREPSKQRGWRGRVAHLRVGGRDLPALRRRGVGMAGTRGTVAPGSRRCRGWAGQGRGQRQRAGCREAHRVALAA